MVAIAPFRALRYNLASVGDLGAVIAPPYDVLNPDDQDRLYARSPHNVVRLILGKHDPADTPASNRYTRAKQTLEAWQREGVLQRDAAPAIYLYEHAFWWDGQPLRRLGFFAALQLTDDRAADVLRHEATFQGPKTDRTHLLDAVQTHLEPVFCVAPDRDGSGRKLTRELADRSKPLASANVPAHRGPASTNGRLPDDEVRFWVINDQPSIDALRNRLQQSKALIADGHHRFEVALSRRATCPTVMVCFAWLEDPALVMRPIHRAVRYGGLSKEARRQQLERLCRLEPAVDAATAVTWLQTNSRPGTFGYYEAGHAYQVTVKPEIMAEWLAKPTVPFALAGLDVSVLHHLLLPGLTTESSAPGGRASAGAEAGTAHDASQRIRYTPDVAEACRLVDADDRVAAWLLRPANLGQVFALAEQGLTMPQKSTYFYPKLASGLCFSPFESALPALARSR